MGVTASSPSTSSHPPSRALHVLRVTPSSPASETDIEAFFDFVVGIEGDSLESSIDASSLEKIVEAHEGRTLFLLVWSSKARTTRTVAINPSRAWSHGSVGQPSLLGLSMRVCEPASALDNVWHILEVLEGSPAESAGLVPYGDWIVGWSGGALGAEGDFYDLVEAHVEKPLRVYVYSADFDTLREVVLVPNRQWGGDGLLGCGVGFGLLHRIPPPSELPSAEELLHDMQLNEETHDLFIPADNHGPPESAGFGLSTFEHGNHYQLAPNEYQPSPQRQVHNYNGHSHYDDDDAHSHDHGHSHDNGHSHEHNHHGHSHDNHNHQHLKASSNDHSPPFSPTASPLFDVVPPSQSSFTTTSTFAPRALRANGIGSRPGTPKASIQLGSPSHDNSPVRRTSAPRIHVSDQEGDDDDDGTSLASGSRADESGSITSVD